MAVTQQTPRNVSTAAPGATVFPYNFRILDKADLLVTVDGTARTVDVHYTVSGVGAAGGGNVTFLSPLAGGETVLRKRAMPLARLTDYQNLGDLRSPTLNNDQDAPVMMIQQLDEAIGRALRIRENFIGALDLTFPDPESSKLIGWNVAGDALRNVDPTGPGDLTLRSDLADPAVGGGIVSFVQSGANATPRTTLDKGREWVSIADFGGAPGASATVNATALQRALATGKSVYLPGGSYALAGAVVTLNNQAILGMGGARVTVQGGGAGIHVASMFRSKIEGIRFVGSGYDAGQTGLRVDAHDLSSVVGCTAEALGTGFSIGPKVRRTWHGNPVQGNYAPSTFSDCKAYVCSTGFHAVDLAEYTTLDNCEAFACRVAGFFIEAGNVPLVNCNATGNEINFWIKGNGNNPGPLTNPDHSGMFGCSANHANACGVYLDGISHSYLLTGCNVWASMAGDHLGTGKSFGLYLRNCRRVVSRGNVYANSTHNIGIDGIAQCSFDDLVTHTAAQLGHFVWIEGNGDFGFNRACDWRFSPTTQNNMEALFRNAAGTNTRAFRVDYQGDVFGVALSGADPAYYMDGRHKRVVASGGYSAGITVSPIMRDTAFEVVVSGVTSPAITVTLPAGSAAYPAHANATTVTGGVSLTGSNMRFTFVPTPTGNGWSIYGEGL